MASSLGNQDGVAAILATFLLLMLLLTLGASTVLFSSIDSRSTTHYGTGRQAFFAAESGILHALSVINSRGVLNFQNDIVAAAQWNRLYGTNPKLLAGDGASSYDVVVAVNPAAPTDTGSITATGLSSLQTRRVINITIRKGIRVRPGALYLANDAVNPDFGARDQFEIDGNDHTFFGDPSPGGPVTPGISTRNDNVTAASIAELSDPQKMRVTGLGFSLDPLTPSIMATEGPSVTDLDQIVNHILANNPVVAVSDPVLANSTYGTLEAPQITHLTNHNVRLDGNMSGAGILIADGSFTINGDANFVGWMIIRGATVLNSHLVGDTLVDGNATILGSLWTGDLLVQVGGSAIIDYCEACLALADGAGNGNNVPRVMAVTSWQELL